MSKILSLLFCSLLLCNGSPASTDTPQSHAQYTETHVFSVVDANGAIILTAENLVSAKVKQIEYPPICAVELSLTAEGQQIFAAASAQIAQKPEGENFATCIFDNAIISQPRILETIDSPYLWITGNFSMEEAQKFAALINSGIQ